MSWSIYKIVTLEFSTKHAILLVVSKDISWGSPGFFMELFASNVYQFIFVAGMFLKPSLVLSSIFTKLT